MSIKRGLTVIIEVDSKFTIGIDMLPPYIFGFRLGFLAMHLLTITLDTMISVEALKGGNR